MAIRGKHRPAGWALLALVALAAVAVAATLGSSGAGASYKAKSYPRVATLVTSGSQWGNIAGMNPYVGNNAAGMIGLVNETLLRYDPLADKYINWLAQSAKWTGAKQYTIVVRPNVTWSDGKTFTGRDVRFNVNLARFNTSAWNNLWQNLKQPIAVKGNTVIFNFKGTPNYVQWQNMIWNMPMISPVQGATIKTAQQLTTYNPHNPVGTGPYKLDTSGFDVTTRVVWAKRTYWWAAQQGLSPSPAPKYIIDLVNTSNTNSLSAVLAGVEDLNNNYLPGVSKLVNAGKVHTYFPKAPYMLSANTAWLEPNTSEAPLNDAVFRRALAMSIDINKIVTDDYGNLVLKASPTGLLPTWNKTINASLVKQYGFTHNADSSEGSAAEGRLQARRLGDVREEGRLEDRPRDRRPAGLVRLGGRPRHDRRVRQGRGDPAPRQGEGLQHLAVRSQHGRVRPRGRQPLPVERQPVDVLERPVPSAGDHDRAPVRRSRTTGVTRTQLRGTSRSSSTRRRRRTRRRSRTSTTSSRRS